ncbi:hypothetical protein HY496_03610 [Candidatus Woesearchaeota archaeon]|nr:hypothetical protein [Candidatus Woesearchaeota archaeon]
MSELMIEINAKKEVDLEEVVKLLHRDRNFILYCRLHSVNGLIYGTDKKTYSSRFKVEVIYEESRRDENGYYILGGLKENGTAQVPEEWAHLVTRIGLVVPLGMMKIYPASIY